MAKWELDCTAENQGPRPGEIRGINYIDGFTTPEDAFGNKGYPMALIKHRIEQFLAQTLAFVHDERIKPLQERLDKLEAERRQRIDGVVDRTGDDIVAKLERLATKAETSKTYVHEFRMMRAEGVADLIHEAMDKIVDLRVELYKAQEDKQ